MQQLPAMSHPFVTLRHVAKLSPLRASDSDREQLAERLRCATAEGRLSANELEERLEVLFAARTYGELDALLADLPVGRSPWRRRVPVARWAGALSAITLMLALLLRRDEKAPPLSVGVHEHEFAPPGGQRAAPFGATIELLAVVAEEHTHERERLVTWVSAAVQAVL